MSVYSGFATRNQETKYNNLLENLVISLKKRLIKFYNQQPCDEDKFKLLIKKIYKKMFLLEKGKFMAPKYSTCFHDLIEFLNIEINYDSLSDASSMVSDTFSLKRDISDTDRDVFKSRAILKNKKNYLETQHIADTLNVSTLSLNKRINTIELQNLNNGEKRSTSVGVAPIQKGKAKTRLRQLKDLKDVRGTMHMPRVQDFLPKRQQMQPSLFKNSQNPIGLARQHKGFRRQKYSRHEISVQQI